MSDVWYFARGGNSVGPVTRADLIDVLSRTPASEHMLVWRSGFSDWQKASEIPELMRAILAPPPLPPPPPPLPLRAAVQPTGSAGPGIISALFSFRGRLNRTQYALVFVLAYLGPMALLVAMEGDMKGDSGALVSLALIIWMLWVLFASLAKRFHDIGKPGAYCLFVFIPFVGVITVLAMLFVRGMSEANEYGPPD